jgi:enamine deaminase RidA (YjgF/YER057c/UK114 family)
MPPSNPTTLVRTPSKIVYIAGQLARDIVSNYIGNGDMRAQMEPTFQNLDRCLKAAGANVRRRCQDNTFVADFEEFHKCGGWALALSRPGDPDEQRLSVSPASPVPIS